MSGRVLIVDDHPIIRDVLVTALMSLNEFDQLDTANSFRQTLEKLARHVAKVRGD